MILPIESLSPEMREWLRAAGDDGRPLYVGEVIDGRTGGVVLACVPAAAPDGADLSPTERERVLARLRAGPPRN